MPMPRSFGVTVLGVFFIFIGGITVLTILFEVIDSWGRYGVSSIAINSPDAARGFFVFFGLPLVIYTAGIAMLLLRTWARKLVLYVIPLTTLLFLGTENISIMGLFVICVLVLYFTRPSVRKQFH